MKHSRAGGFSLLELLVALAVMAIALGMLYRSTGNSARSVSDAAQYQQAMVLASSLLAVRDAVPEAGWNESGQAGAYQWRIQSAPHPTPVSEANPTAARLHEVVFHIQWDDGGVRTREVEIATLLPQTTAAGLPGGRR